MSDAHTVSPLLDAYTLGEPVRDHHGITCTPAIHQVTQEKFMLKHISVPESQIQVDAMLLTGACENKEAAKSYYADMARELTEEVEAFRRLARGRGFVPFFAHQEVEKTGDEIGTDLYVLSPFRTTLAAYVKSNPMTHLAAVNLGLDLCASLVLARKAGYIYLNLKPENITVTSQRQFQAADFGLMKLDTLPYATFPDKYRSTFTAPELFDDLAEISTSADVYSLGMVLYTIFNCGQPPFPGEDGEIRRRNGEALPAPAAAPKEMAEIILKAAAFKPEDRWQSPEEMGTALIAYFQTNSVNDSELMPITPPEPETPVEEAPQEDAPTAEAPAEDIPAEEAPAEETPAEEAPVEDAPVEDAPTECPPAEEAPAEEAPAEEVPAEEAPVETPPVQDAPAPEVPQEKAPARVLPEVAPEEMEDLLDRMNSFLDAPQEPPAPEAASADEEEAEDEDKDSESGKRPFRNLFVTLAAVLVAAGLILGGLVFYFQFYRVPVDALEITEAGLDSLAVSVSSRFPELYLTCQDTYGNTFRSDMKDGKVVFTGLNPGTQYTVTAMADGFHSVTGTSKVSAATLTQTEIVDFGSMIGAENGAVVLYFTVNGAEPSEWTVRYSAEGEAERTHSFTGHTVSIAGLSVGKEYTFTLEAGDGFFLKGEHTLTLNAEAVILAQNLRVTAYGDDSVTVAWDEPNVPVESWTARCYSGDDFSQTVTVTDCTATITGVDLAKPCTVDVTADGMTQNTWIAMTAYPACLSGCSVGLDNPGEMEVSWTYTGTAPAQWVFQYSYGDDNAAIEPIVTGEDRAVISPMLPNTRYVFTIQSSTGSSVFNHVFAAALPEASAFTGYGVNSCSLTTYPTPQEPEPEQGEDADNDEPENDEPWTWRAGDLLPENRKDTFSPEDTMVFLLAADSMPEASEDEIRTMILIRNADGVPESYLTSLVPWSSLWDGDRYACELTQLPAAPGTYNLEVYLNGQIAGQCEFTVN